MIKMTNRSTLARARGIRLKNWHKYTEHIINIYMFFKSILYVVLECYYVQLQSKRPESDHPVGVVRAHEQLVLEHRLLMQRYGLAFRELNTATIFGYAMIVSILGIFNYVNYFTRNRASKLYESNDIVINYKNPEIAERNLIRLFDVHINKVIESNRQTIRVVMHFWSRTCSWSTATTKELKPIEILDKQRNHLLGLLSDKSSIWPSNSTAAWRQKQTKQAFYLYSIISIVLLLGTVMATYFAHVKSYLSLMATGQLPLNQLERLAMAELAVGAIATGDPFISSIVVLMTNFYNRKSQLKNIGERLRALNNSLLKLRRMSHLSARKNVDLEFRLALREHLDKQAIELYLSLRVFMAELKPVIRLANMILNQCLMLIISVLTITLLFYTEIDSTQANILGIMTFNFIGSLDIAFGIGAAFDASYEKTIRLIWSLLANSCPRQRSSLVSLGKSSFTLSRAEIIIPPDDSMISPHAIFLWRQLISEQQSTYSKANCMMLNLIHLNYQSLLKMNFWLISAVLICLTEREATSLIVNEHPRSYIAIVHKAE